MKFKEKLDRRYYEVKLQFHQEEC